MTGLGSSSGETEGETAADSASAGSIVFAGECAGRPEAVKQLLGQLGALPTGRQIDEDTARVHLTIAPVYLRTMQLLSTYLTGTPPGASA